MAMWMIFNVILEFLHVYAVFSAQFHLGTLKIIRLSGKLGKPSKSYNRFSRPTQLSGTWLLARSSYDCDWDQAFTLSRHSRHVNINSLLPETTLLARHHCIIRDGPSKDGGG
jgi:hypothetical protein